MKKLGWVGVLALLAATASAATEEVTQPTSMVVSVERTGDRLFGEFVLLQQDVVSKLRPWLVGKAPVTAADVIKMRTPPPAGPIPQYFAQSLEPPQPIAQPPYWEQNLPQTLETDGDSPATSVDADPAMNNGCSSCGACTRSCNGTGCGHRAACCNRRTVHTCGRLRRHR